MRSTKCTPTTEICVPPLVGPTLGKILCREGASINLNEKPVGSKLMPSPPSSVSTTPTACAGETHCRIEDVTRVAVTTCAPNEQEVYKFSCRTSRRTVTRVPPWPEPIVGLTSSTPIGSTYSNPPAMSDSSTLLFVTYRLTWALWWGGDSHEACEADRTCASTRRPPKSQRKPRKK